MADNVNEKDMLISVDDGARRVPVMNGLGEEIGSFTFRPTDVGIIERYNRLADSFAEITRPLEALGEADGEEQKLAALKEAQRRLFAAVNALFEGDVAGAFFGGMNPFSPVNGAFYCELALRAVGAFIDRQFETETAKLTGRARRYAARAGRHGG